MSLNLFLSALFPTQKTHKSHSFLLKVKPAKKITFDFVFSPELLPLLLFIGKSFKKELTLTFPTSPPPIHLPLQQGTLAGKEPSKLKVYDDLTTKYKGCFPAFIHVDLFATPGSADLIPELTPPQPLAHLAATISFNRPVPQTSIALHEIIPLAAPSMSVFMGLPSFTLFSFVLLSLGKSTYSSCLQNYTYAENSQSTDTTQSSL